VYAARKVPQGKLYAFEPVKETFELLQSNKQINKLENIFCTNYGLSDSNRNVEFRTGSAISQPGASAYDLGKMGYSTDKYNKSWVNLRDINQSIQELGISKINVLKVDCEGEEFALLYHLDRAILSGCRLCMVEYHNIHKNRDYTGQKLAEYLNGLGFDVRTEPYYLAQNTGMIYAKIR
jgi:FkbM family methyltransferase